MAHLTAETLGFFLCMKSISGARALGDRDVVSARQKVVSLRRRVVSFRPYGVAEGICTGGRGGV